MLDHDDQDPTQPQHEQPTLHPGAAEQVTGLAARVLRIGAAGTVVVGTVIAATWQRPPGQPGDCEWDNSITGDGCLAHCNTTEREHARVAHRTIDAAVFRGPRALHSTRIHTRVRPYVIRRWVQPGVLRIEHRETE